MLPPNDLILRLPLNDAEPKYALIVDRATKRPAGMFMQVLHGCDVELLNLFQPHVVLNRPKPDLERFEGTLAEWTKFAQQRNAEHYDE